MYALFHYRPFYSIRMHTVLHLCAVQPTCICYFVLKCKYKYMYNCKNNDIRWSQFIAVIEHFFFHNHTRGLVAGLIHKKANIFVSS